MLRAQGNQTNDLLALIPSWQLVKDLPRALVFSQVHWLNLSTKIIEICPTEEPWKESPENWKIDCTSTQFRLYRGRETSVDSRSPTWAMVSQCFHGTTADLSPGPQLIITTSPIDSTSKLQLSVSLPSFSLSFFVNEKEELESRDFKDMVYDEDQCVGALFGLENLLVLRPKTHLSGTPVPEALIPRCVLILATDERSYHTYFVDTDLGCLRGNGSVASTEFLAWQHGRTSLHRPDPLTGKTGAQAALDLHQSAGYLSMTKDDVLHSGSTLNPFTNDVYYKIPRPYYWNLFPHAHKAVTASEKDSDTAQQAVHPFPTNATGSLASPQDCDDNQTSYSTISIPSEPRLPTLPPTVSSLRFLFNAGSPSQITLNHLMRNRVAPQLPSRIPLLSGSYKVSSDDISALDQLFCHLLTDRPFQREYLAHLAASAQHAPMEHHMNHRMVQEHLIQVEALKEHYMKCRVTYLNSLGILKKTLGPATNPYEQALSHFGHWPPITADVLLRCLASTSPIVIPSCWKKCLTSLALLLLDLQRSRRLLRFALDGLEEEFLKELENRVCDGWNPDEYPDWLLIQVGFFHHGSLLYSQCTSSVSGSRKLSHPPFSDRHCNADHVATIRSKHGDAGQHGRREIICYHPHCCCRPCRRRAACSRHCPESVDSSDVRTIGCSPWRPG